MHSTSYWSQSRTNFSREGFEFGNCMTSPMVDSLVAYLAAQKRSEAVRETWAALGSPILCEGSRGQPRAHVLLHAMAEADAHADRLRRRITPAHPGPSPAAVITSSPAARLRASRGHGQKNGG